MISKFIAIGSLMCAVTLAEVPHDLSGTWCADSTTEIVVNGKDLQKQSYRLCMDIERKSWRRDDFLRMPNNQTEEMTRIFNGTAMLQIQPEGPPGKYICHGQMAPAGYDPTTQEPPTLSSSTMMPKTWERRPSTACRSKSGPLTTR